MEKERDQETTYKQATEAWNAGRYQEARMLFASLDRYRDSLERAEDCLAHIEERYRLAFKARCKKDYAWAVAQFLSIKDYKDSQTQIEEIMALDHAKEKSPEEYAYRKALLSRKRVHRTNTIKRSVCIMKAIRYQDSEALVKKYEEMIKRNRIGLRVGLWMIIIIHLFLIGLIVYAFTRG